MGVFDEIKASFRKGSILTRLIYINLGVFVFVRIAYVFFYLADADFVVLDWLSLPAGKHQFLLAPWTLITYMFLHFDFLHILFNLLWLYWMGKIFLLYFDEKRFLSIYLLGGISGGLLFMLAYNLFPVFAKDLALSRLMGASASVLAIITAVAAYAPNHAIRLLFLGQIKIKHIAIVSVVLYVIGIASSNAGGNIAHLGGAALGCLFAVSYRKGRDITTMFIALSDKISKFIRLRRPLKVSHRKGPDMDMEYNRRKNLKQEEINKILDKISKSGYDSLTKEEKELLFRMGR